MSNETKPEKLFLRVVGAAIAVIMCSIAVIAVSIVCRAISEMWQ